MPAPPEAAAPGAAQDAASTPPDLAGEASVVRPDAAHVLAPPADAGEEDLEVDAACVPLLERSSEAARALDGGPIVGHTVQELGCPLLDSSDKNTSTIFERADGLPLMRAGQTVSFRWPMGTWMPKLRLYGGAQTCSLDSVYQESPPVVSPVLAAPECRAFQVDEDVRYVRLLHDYTTFSPFPPYITFQLCRSACPAK